jgi:eIF3 subunit 6 N terminal domain
MAVEEAEAVAAAPAGAHKYDLTNTISEYLDLHLMFPLLDFVEISGMYPGQGVAQARLELLEPTNMVRKHIIRRVSNYVCAVLRRDIHQLPAHMSSNA